jgi:hypothetical protein
MAPAFPVASSLGYRGSDDVVESCPCGGYGVAAGAS